MSPNVGLDVLVSGFWENRAVSIDGVSVKSVRRYKNVVKLALRERLSYFSGQIRQLLHLYSIVKVNINDQGLKL